MGTRHALHPRRVSERISLRINQLLYMQTFFPIPVSSYKEQARVLDNKRLNKQALEAWQIMMVSLEVDPEGNYRSPKGWRNHPAVAMWRGYEYALYEYLVAMVEEWRRRGFKSTIDVKAKATLDAIALRGLVLQDHTPPPWIRNTEKLSEISKTHRIALLVKDYDHYKQFGWEEDSGEPPESYSYIWS